MLSSMQCAAIAVGKWNSYDQKLTCSEAAECKEWCSPLQPLTHEVKLNDSHHMEIWGLFGAYICGQKWVLLIWRTCFPRSRAVFTGGGADWLHSCHVYSNTVVWKCR